MVIPKLYGLVLTGGKSRRMHHDKSALVYHGKEQSVYCYELLSLFCDKVFLSNRRDQANEAGHKGYPQIHDTPPYLDKGPIGGILSAMNYDPKVSWFILACDLPFVNSNTVEYLTERRDSEKLATSFLNNEGTRPEPLCAIYEAKSKAALESYFQKGNLCPRQFLISINSDARLLKQLEPHELDNINLPEEYQAALNHLRNEKGHENY